MTDEDYRIAGEKYRAALEAERDATWNAHYRPYIVAACSPDPASADCALARLKTREMFLEREQREEHDRAMEHAADQAATNAGRPRVCNTIGTTTICN